MAEFAIIKKSTLTGIANAIRSKKNVAQPFPSGYTELEYIECTGSQYIDLGLMPNQNTRVVMDFQADKEACHLFGSRTAFQDTSFLVCWQSNFDYCVQVNSICINGGEFDTKARHIVDMTASTFKLDGATKATYTVDAFQTEYNLYIASCPNSNLTSNENMVGKIHSFQYYDGSDLIRDLVPCKNSDGETGMVDRIGVVFYPSLGIDAFMAGPELANSIDECLIPTSKIADEILSIETGSDIADTTLTSGDQLLYPLTAYSAEGNLITGTIQTKTRNDLSVDGAQVKVPAGYYAELATKSVATTGLGTPTIAVDANGKITATVTHTASGYVEAGAKSATKQLVTQAAQTITPSTSVQTAVASGVYTTGDVKVAALTDHGTITPGTSSKTYTGKVTVSGDSDLKANNIKSGVSIFGVTGTYSPVSNPIIAIGTKKEYDLFNRFTFTLDKSLTDWNVMFLTCSPSWVNHYTIVNSIIIKKGDSSFAYSYTIWNYDSGSYYIESAPDFSQMLDVVGTLTSSNSFTVDLSGSAYYFEPNCTYTLHVIGY